MSLEDILKQARRAKEEAAEEPVEEVGAACSAPVPPGVTDHRTIPPEEIHRTEELFASTPHDFQLQAYLAFLYYAGKRYEDAIRHFEALLAAGYNPATQHFHLGNCYFRLGRPEEAVAQWKSCLAASPSREIAAKMRSRLEWIRFTGPETVGQG